MLSARDPADLLTAVPYLLGYQPVDSLVFVSLRERRLEMCARMDLAVAEHPELLAERIRSIVEAQHVEAALLVGYGPVELVRRALRVVMEELARPRSVTVVEAVHTDGERWWSLSCSDVCCPPEGTPYDRQTNRMAAEAVWAGLGVMPSRAEIAESVLGPPTSLHGWLRSKTAETVRMVRSHSLAERQRWMVELVEDCLADLAGEGGRPDLDDCLEMAALAADIAVRDVAWAMINRADARDHVRLWQQVVRLCVPETACPALCLLGMAAWISGNGTLQVCCLERAEKLRPSYTMVRLLSDINAGAASPALWDRIGPGLRTELGLTSSAVRLA